MHGFVPILRKCSTAIISNHLINTCLKISSRTGWVTAAFTGGKPGERRWDNFFDAFPDAKYALNDLFFAGDKGVWRGTWHATQRKQWEGIPATGRKAKWTVIIISRFEGERLAEDWVEYDRYNLFRQLGV